MIPKSSPRSRSELFWLAAIVTIVVLLRVVSLGADPMPELDWGFISDSGTWWKNPRLHAIWGVWMVDDGNYGILTAPAYTVVMRLVFAVLGVGYAQAYTASAISGVLVTLLVYVMVRRDAGAPTALLAAALVGINSLTIAYDRSAYPESFQLMMMVATVAAILASPGRPWLAALGGVAVAIVLFAKPPGIVLAPIATMTWAALWITRRRSATSDRFEASGLVAYAAAALVVIGIVGAVYFRPYASDVMLHFRTQMADGATLGAAATDRVLLFASPLGFRLNGFFRIEWYLLIATAVFGALRIARVVRLPVTTIELASWVWLILGLGIMGLQTYQQDRRFLFLVPPLSILSALMLNQVIEVGESAWVSVRARRIAMGTAAGVVALVLCFYLVPFGVWKMITVGRVLGRTWTYGFAGGLLLSAIALGCAALAAWWGPSLRWRGNARWQSAIALAPLLVTIARSGSEVLNRSRGLENVARALHQISAEWPDNERVAAGWPAGTLTLGSGVLPVNHELKGASAAVRFRPQFELYAISPGQPLKQASFWAVPGRPLKVDCTQLPIWDDARGKPRIIVHVFVEPDRLAACQAAARRSAHPGATNAG